MLGKCGLKDENQSFLVVLNFSLLLSALSYCSATQNPTTDPPSPACPVLLCPPLSPSISTPLLFNTGDVITGAPGAAVTRLTTNVAPITEPL